MEYHGKEDIKKYLTKHGITDFRVWDVDLVNEETDKDENYSVNPCK